MTKNQCSVFARSLLTTPKTLIFAEPTSCPDAPTSELPAQTVNRLKASGTTRFISHYVPPGLQVDEIVSLDGLEAAIDSERAA